MSSSLAGQTVVIIGGSSGIGYGVAKASLLERAAHVIIGSSSKDKVEDAVKRLTADVASASVEGDATGYVIDGKDSASVKAFFEKVGDIDHLVWTSGDGIDVIQKELEDSKGVFDVRFWGAALAAKVAKIKEGGSITLTASSLVVKPRPNTALGSAVSAAVDGYTRALALDMAPIRVNSVCPGAVKTELWNPLPPAVQQKLLDDLTKILLVRHVAEPDEIAGAYIFLMKCKYITGQKVILDGGGTLV